MLHTPSLPVHDVSWLGPLSDFVDIPDQRPTGELESRWAASGAMSLTGPSDTALLCPLSVLDRMQSIEEVRRSVAPAGGDAPGLSSPFDLLVERAALTGQSRRGTTSCGGHTRLLQTSDGWIALSLARAEDTAAVPAWIGQFSSVDLDMSHEVWPAIASVLATSSSAVVVSAGQLLGLPVSELGEYPTWRRPIELTASVLSNNPRALDEIVVVDLSSLWAGPLCSRMLAEGGASVIKVESRNRPDGARFGHPKVFDLLNGRSRSVALDFEQSNDRALLARLLQRADVVIEGSRPRVLEQWGLAPEQVMGQWGTKVWVSLTGYGRTGDGRSRVAFGDDAAVAGGLVAWHDGKPNFVLDAVADPLSGLMAAAAVGAALRSDQGWLLDISLARVAAWVNGGSARKNEWRPASFRPDLIVAAPGSPLIPFPAPDFGADTDAVLNDLVTF